MTIPETPGGRRERVRRPESVRTRPVRGGWIDLFGAPGSPPRAAGAPEGAPSAARRPEPLSRAVELGYRVVDDYIRQGQNAARLVGQRAYGPQAAQQDAQNLMLRMYQYASELSALWFDFIGMSATGWPVAPADPSASVRPHPPSAVPSDRAPSAAAPAASSTAVSVRLDANRPVELSTDLRPVADGASLRVHALRAASALLPNLDDLEVSCEGAGTPVVVRIRIPHDHPAGTYSGVVVDGTTNVPVGTIQVRIPE